MKNYADRLIAAIKEKGNPCVVGLDPRLDSMPDFVVASHSAEPRAEAVRSAITTFNRIIIEAVSPHVPAVKLQAAFYEQYGLPGLHALEESIGIAKEHGLVVIVDAKRNDISSTAEAYANAYLGRSAVFGSRQPVFDVDCITVSPFLGGDSLKPFIDACSEYGKGIFILVKTSNPGSVDLQNQLLSRTGEPLYKELARLVDGYGEGVVGESGYSSVGAVVGATFPEEAKELRKIMPRTIFLVPGFGAQGGTGRSAAACFNADGLGAVVSASRSITYPHRSADITRGAFAELVGLKVKEMVGEVRGALLEL
jgi:orotidine-5'-phosphate decarboxylase